jgi:hypothetical protein
MTHPVAVRRVVGVFAVLIAVLVGGCGTTSTSATGSAEWTKHLREFENGYFARNPSFAVQQGQHEYDGRLPDWSAAGIHADVQSLYAQRTQAERSTRIH